MPAVFIVALSLHVLSAIFWAGSTFVLARTAGLGLDRLRVPQLGAAFVAAASGAYLGHAAHGDTLTRAQWVLLAGAALALVAAALQVIAAIRARSPERLGFNVAVQRAAAGLLAATALCMVLARYA
jgi:hypothetical protein